MLALKDYGSSDSESENENENRESEVNNMIDSTNVVNSIFAKNLTASINMQICSAPEVIPTVNIYLLL